MNLIDVDLVLHIHENHGIRARIRPRSASFPHSPLQSERRHVSREIDSTSQVRRPRATISARNRDEDQHRTSWRTESQSHPNPRQQLAINGGLYAVRKSAAPTEFSESRSVIVHQPIQRRLPSQHAPASIMAIATVHANRRRGSQAIAAYSRQAERDARRNRESPPTQTIRRNTASDTLVSPEIRHDQRHRVRPRNRKA